MGILIWLLFFFGHCIVQSIKRSECPRELEPADRRTVVNVNLFRRLEDYRVCLYENLLQYFFSELKSD